MGFFFFKQDQNHKNIKKKTTYLISWNLRTYVRESLHVVDILNVSSLATNFWMSFRCLGNYLLYKFCLPKTEARNPLSQAPLQLVLRLVSWFTWAHCNFWFRKSEMKKKVPHGINYIESGRETSSSLQWHPAHWKLEESSVSGVTMHQLNLDTSPSFVASEINCLFLLGTSVTSVIFFNKLFFCLH